MRLFSKKKPLVFVGLSGGVDSSVAAARLLDQGYRVVGVFIKVWQPDFLKCDWEQERLDAMRVAAHLKIPFLTLDAAADYKKEVGDYFVGEYLAGRTPNPDVMCNRHVKFGAFWRFAKSHGAEFIATGHYARIVGTQVEQYKLLRGVDTKKDQSYFLWTLTQDDLAHTLFPVGNSTKEEIRSEAIRRGLPTAIKKDSQGICFLGHVDIKEFLGHFTSLQDGGVMNAGGQEIGRHDGALIYTLGQRHGFTIFGEAGREPHYVIDKDVEKNTITVALEAPTIPDGKIVKLTAVNLHDANDFNAEIETQIRYRQTPFKAELSLKEGNNAILTPLQETEKPAIGQSVVFYDGEVCLGGGVVNG